MRPPPASHVPASSMASRASSEHSMVSVPSAASASPSSSSSRAWMMGGGGRGSVGAVHCSPMHAYRMDSLTWGQMMMSVHCGPASSCTAVAATCGRAE